jgi:rSAM/selenodomain-associated transferase 2
MRISVVIPVLNEESTLASTLDGLQSFSAEVVVVDGGSNDRTREIAEQKRATLITSPPGRARQMNAGAETASGDVFLFLHADTYLPRSAMADIVSALQDPYCVGGRFDIQLDGPGWMFRLIGFLISLRSRWSRVATGDQAIFVRKEVFRSLAGYPEIPLMEDVEFCRRLKKMGKVACLKSQVVTSARRWEKEGVWRTILKMWALKFLFLIGVSPFRLKRFYGDTR